MVKEKERTGLYMIALVAIVAVVAIVVVINNNVYKVPAVTKTADIQTTASSNMAGQAFMAEINKDALKTATVIDCNKPENMGAAKCKYSLKCDVGTYATGLGVGAGMIVDSLRLICRPPSFETNYVTDQVGGSGGGYDSFECANGKFMTGVSTYISKFNGVYYPSKLSPICDGVVDTSKSFGWGTDGLAGPWKIECPKGKALIALNGEAGEYKKAGSFIYSIKNPAICVSPPKMCTPSNSTRCMDWGVLKTSFKYFNCSTGSKTRQCPSGVCKNYTSTYAACVNN